MRSQVAERRLNSLVRDARRVARSASNSILSQLLRTLDSAGPVALSWRCPTACCTGTDRGFRIEINPEFLLQIRDGASMLQLLLHEVLHAFLGDLTLRVPPGERGLWNIAADLVIDNYLLAQFPELFNPPDDLRSATVPDVIPDPLHANLAPAPLVMHRTDTDGHFTRRNLTRAANTFWRQYVTPPDPAGEVPYNPLDWATVYASQTVAARRGETSTPRVVEALHPLLAQLSPEQRKKACEGQPDPLSPAERDALRATARRLLDELQLPFTPEQGLPATTPGGDSGLSEVQSLVVHAGRVKARAAVERAMRDTPTGSPEHHIARSESEPSPYGHLTSRRSLLRHVAGTATTPFARRAPGMELTTRGAPLLLDVSGSMSPVLPALIGGLCADCGELLEHPVHEFSTRVVPVSLDELKTGRVVTRQGTDFDVVAEWLLTRSPACAVVVTDGYGRMSPALGNRLRASGIRLVLLLVQLPHSGLVPATPFDHLVLPGCRVVLNGLWDR